MRRYPMQSRGGRTTALLLAGVATGLLAAPGPVVSPTAQAPTVKQAMMAQPSRPAETTSALLTSERPLSSGGPRCVPGHIVVKFMPQLSRRTLQVIAGEVGGSEVIRPSYADFHYVTIPEDVDPAEAAAKIARDPDVIYAEPDYVVRPDYVPNDPLYKYQWNLQKLGMEQAWDVNKGGSSSVIVAVLDTGAAYADKGAFKKAPDMDAATFVAGYDLIWDDAEPFDFDGHGTHVSGTIAQLTNNSVGVAGMAFGVRLMPVKVLYGDWDETWNAPYPYGSSTVARGIRFALDHGAKVINMSLGALGPNSATLDALREAVSRKAFVAISAGNEGDNGNSPTWPATYAKELEGVMAVAAVDYNLARAPYSSFRDYVEIAAPGGNLRADLNNDTYGDGILQNTLDPTYQEAGVFDHFAYMFYQGTSMAAPHVAALAAMLIDQGVTSPQAVEAAIKRFARNKPSSGRNDEIGSGIIDPRATLRGLGLAR